MGGGGERGVWCVGGDEVGVWGGVILVCRGGVLLVGGGLSWCARGGEVGVCVGGKGYHILHVNFELIILVCSNVKIG